MNLTRPQRLQQARTAAYNAAAANASVLHAASSLGIGFCGLVCAITGQRRKRVTQVEVLVGAKAKTTVLRRRRGQKEHIRLSSKISGLGRITRPAAAATQDKCSPP